MGVLNFGDLRVLLVGILITAVMLTLGFCKKKSIFAGIMLVLFLVLLIMHTINTCPKVNVFVDLTGMAACITAYLIIDEIEIRRKKITQVFEDRYKD